MKFIKTQDIIKYEKQIIKNAKTYLCIVSPFIQASDEMLSLLASLREKRVKTVLVCGKEALRESELKKLLKLNDASVIKSIEIYF